MCDGSNDATIHAALRTTGILMLSGVVAPLRLRRSCSGGWPLTNSSTYVIDQSEQRFLVALGPNSPVRPVDDPVFKALCASPCVGRVFVRHGSAKVEVATAPLILPANGAL